MNTEHDMAHQHTEHEHMDHAQHKSKKHQVHSGHEMMFRNRFWVSLILTIPVLLFSPMIQEWFGFSLPVSAVRNAWICLPD